MSDLPSYLAALAEFEAIPAWLIEQDKPTASVLVRVFREEASDGATVRLDVAAAGQAAGLQLVISRAALMNALVTPQSIDPPAGPPDDWAT